MPFACGQTRSTLATVLTSPLPLTIFHLTFSSLNVAAGSTRISAHCGSSTSTHPSELSQTTEEPSSKSIARLYCAGSAPASSSKAASRSVVPSSNCRSSTSATHEASIVPAGGRTASMASTASSRSEESRMTMADWSSSGSAARKTSSIPAAAGSSDRTSAITSSGGVDAAARTR